MHVGHSRGVHGQEQLVNDGLQVMLLSSSSLGYHYEAGVSNLTPVAVGDVIDEHRCAACGTAAQFEAASVSCRRSCNDGNFRWLQDGTFEDGARASC